MENDVSMGDSWDRTTQITKEVDNYLHTKTCANIEDGLKDFPIIRKMFLKFNCIRSSEAICERMFSYAGTYCIFLVEKSFMFCVVCFVSFIHIYIYFWNTVSVLVLVQV